MTWLCKRCGRHKFQRPGHHKCQGQYRGGLWFVISKAFKYGFLDFTQR